MTADEADMYYPSDLLNIPEAARYLKVCPQTIRKLVKQGTLTPFRYKGIRVFERDKLYEELIIKT